MATIRTERGIINPPPPLHKIGVCEPGVSDSHPVEDDFIFSCHAMKIKRFDVTINGIQFDRSFSIMF